jgi:hypothetical protein
MGSPTQGYKCGSISRACGFEWSLGIANLPAVQWLILVWGQKQDMSMFLPAKKVQLNYRVDIISASGETVGKSCGVLCDEVGI